MTIDPIVFGLILWLVASIGCLFGFILCALLSANKSPTKRSTNAANR